VTLPADRRDIEDLADVEDLVRRFYRAAIPDPMLGPLFAGFGVDWSVHIPKLVDFWAARLFDRPGYTGNAVGAHQVVLERCGFGTTELGRWLDLWAETVDEVFAGPIADRAKQRAQLAGQAIESLIRRHARGSRSLHLATEPAESSAATLHDRSMSSL
jgi:hemoglobin